MEALQSLFNQTGEELTQQLVGQLESHQRQVSLTRQNSDQIKELFRCCRHSVRMILGLIDDLLDLAKQE
jgi:hypothetical protein